MTLAFRTSSHIVAGALLATPGLSAAAQVTGVPAVVIDRELRQMRVQLLRIDLGADAGSPARVGTGGGTGEIVVVDDSGQRRTLRANDIVGIAPPDWVPAASPALPAATASGSPGAPSALPLRSPTIRTITPPPSQSSRLARGTTAWIELADGQLFPGRLGTPATKESGPAGPGLGTAGEGAILWEHERLGPLVFSIENTSRLVLEPRLLAGAAVAGTLDPALAARTGDVVRLINGDRVQGFVESIGAEIIVDRAGAGEKTGAGGAPKSSTRIPAERIATVTLSTPPTRGSGPTVWLADGTVAGVSRLASDGDEGRLTLALRPPHARGNSSFELADLRGVLTEAGAIVPLAMLRIAEQSPGEGRAGAEPVLIDWDKHASPGTSALPPVFLAADVVLPGPMSVRWTLPTGSVRVAGWATIEERSYEWGDCTVILELTGPGAATRELARGRIFAGEPSFWFRADLGESGAGQGLRVRIDPGPTGPIQDRVVLQRVLIQTKPGK